MKHNRYIPKPTHYFQAFIKHGKLKGHKHKFSPFKCVSVYKSKDSASTINAVSCDLEWILESWKWDFR